MEQERFLFFPSSSAAGRIGNVLVAFLGFVALPFLLAAILWGMVRAPSPAAFLFPLFGLALVLLYMAAGPLWACGAGIFASLVGEIYFLFSESLLEKVQFLLGVALVWSLFALMNQVGRRCRYAHCRIDEEEDRLDLDISRLSSENLELRAAIQDHEARIAAYHRLQVFTDDLLGVYTRDELVRRARKGLEDLFPGAEIGLRFFPEPDRPEEQDAWGQETLQSSQSRLYPSAKIAAPSLKSGAFMFVPLKAHENRWGWASLENKKGRGLFEIGDLRLATIAADLISLALANVDLYVRTEAMAISDSLTGLYTRGYFMERLREEFAKARHKSAPLSLMIFDVDFFKEINDAHGHHIGDEVLRWLSRLVLSQSRETDFVARYGGDEFIVLMPHTQASDALDFGKRLCRNVSGAIFSWGGKKVRPSISGGVASLSGDMEDELGFIQRADAALYKAKELGRGRVEGA